MVVPIRGNGIEDLLQIVLTFGPPRLLPQLHRPGGQEPHKDADDGNDYQQLDERKPCAVLLVAQHVRGDSPVVDRTKAALLCQEAPGRPVAWTRIPSASRFPRAPAATPAPRAGRTGSALGWRAAPLPGPTVSCAASSGPLQSPVSSQAQTRR